MSPQWFLFPLSFLLGFVLTGTVLVAVEALI